MNLEFTVLKKEETGRGSPFFSLTAFLTGEVTDFEDRWYGLNPSYGLSLFSLSGPQFPFL